jgi:hypothetical protein
VATAALSGCYASTEPATNVTVSRATLNARGTANSGPASSYFQYGPTGTDLLFATARQEWPAGASGRFTGTTATGLLPLEPGTEYRFRVCGNDAGEEPVCAQWRTFRTPSTPVQDEALGYWRYGFGAGSPEGQVDARADRDGSNARGTLWVRQPFDAVWFSGRVTCLSVSGHSAVVGAVGRRTTDGSEPDPNAAPNASAVLRIRDDDPNGDFAAVALSSTTTPPACTGGPEPIRSLSPTLDVYDAP